MQNLSEGTRKGIADPKGTLMIRFHCVWKLFFL